MSEEAQRQRFEDLRKAAWSPKRGSASRQLQGSFSEGARGGSADLDQTGVPAALP